MANVPIDPRPHLPAGFTWKVRVAPREPKRMMVFLGPSSVKRNENLAIACLNPPVNKIDFYPMAQALLRTLRVDHHARQAEVEQCPFGDAYARFNCPLERACFLNAPLLHFGQYSIIFIKLDQASNARAIDMDREAWIMLLVYPNDYREDHEIDKSISGFAILKHIHCSSNAARVVVKVLVNKKDDIPDEIVVSPGESPRAQSWTVAVFILHAQDVDVQAAEDALPPKGPLHPIPPPGPRWVGAEREISQAQPPTANAAEDTCVGNSPLAAIDGMNADAMAGVHVGGSVDAHVPEV